LTDNNDISRNQKEKASRKDEKPQSARKAFLCGVFAALRLCVKVVCFSLDEA